MSRFRRFAVALGAAAVLAGCSDEPVGIRSPGPETPPPQAALDRIFAEAGAEFRVPAELLKAVGFAETRFQMVRGEVEFEGQQPAFGIMALRGGQLEHGALLAHVTPEAARFRPEANIRAAAAVLSGYADELRISRASLGAWAPAVARYSGIQQPEGQAAYVHDDVYAALRSGAQGVSPGGQVLVTLAPQNVLPDFPTPQAPPEADRESAFAASAMGHLNIVWRPSPNYNDRPTGSIGEVHMVVIHTCESGYSGCWSWLTNSSSGVSAHYVVKEDGSEISKLVYESKRAWHIGAKYYCSNNGGHECWRDGYSSNHFTIGIEHGGYASQSSFPTSQIKASAELSCEISKRHSIPRDRYHYVAHGKLQPYDRTDPGPNWPWSDYMNRMNGYCGSAIIIDSNNNNNDTSKGYLDTGAMSADWVSSTGVSGYYGTGYYYAKTAPISDPATFWFYLPAAATRTVDAWWTTHTNRSTTAPFIAWNASGTKLGTVQVNQQVNGGKWNQLGTYSFSAGWNKIQLSRWTTEGYYVIADAVRIR
ncbi:MAG TPA: N-acetylmuramoyl-L-alanine amidase [Longimicrobiaceae bacterium]|nr:N-acetylmuramoyl-L-alanine amidase [Longimicrobiaceae bacterium]